jgi:hypothetical protein
MKLSLNEIEVTARKASLGAGLPLGLAEEAGAAAAWLAAAGFPVAPLLAEALELGHQDAVQTERSGSILRFRGAGPACSALGILPSACDLVIAAAAMGERVTAEAVIDVPAWALAQAAIAAAGSGVALQVETATQRALLQGESLTLSGAIEPFVALRSAPVRIRVPAAEAGRARDHMAAAELRRNRSRALQCGVCVEDAPWQRVQSLAARTLVPATTQSREHGAGAGLIDTD